jgi:hypothetical protein
VRYQKSGAADLPGGSQNLYLQTIELFEKSGFSIVFKAFLPNGFSHPLGEYLVTTPYQMKSHALFSTENLNLGSARRITGVGFPFTASSVPCAPGRTSPRHGIFPRRSMFIAALKSRSRMAPQDGHRHSLFGQLELPVDIAAPVASLGGPCCAGELDLNPLPFWMWWGLSVTSADLKAT